MVGVEEEVVGFGIRQERRLANGLGKRRIGLTIWLIKGGPGQTRLGEREL